MRSLGKDLLGAALVAKRFSQRRCGHKKNPVDASSCILAMIGKKLLNYVFVVSHSQTAILFQLRSWNKMAVWLRETNVFVHCTIVHLQKWNIGNVRMCVGAGVVGCAMPCH